MQEELQFPSGLLSWESDTSFRITVKPNRRRTIETILNSVQHLKNSAWLIPSLVSSVSETYLHYSSPNPITPLTTVVTDWRNQVQRYAPCWFLLLKSMQQSYELVSFRYSTFLPLSPATVFVSVEPEERLNFRLAFIPAFQPALSDWAGSNSVSWQWLNKEAFLQLADFDPAFSAAALLYYCCAGFLVDEKFPKQEQFTRFWSGRTGQTGMFRNLIEEALPATMKDDESAVLSDQLKQLLYQQYTTGTKPELPAYLSNNLSILRVASRWEYEEKNELALSLWLDTERWHGASSVSWDRVARLYEKVDNPAKAENALLQGMTLSQEDSFRQLARYLLERTRNTPQGILTQLLPLIDKCKGFMEESQQELLNIQVAHLFLKYDHDHSKALGFLSLKCTDKWRRIQQSLVLAKIYLSLQQLSNVSKICCEGILLARNDLTSSVPVSSIQAYFYLMDGVANFQAIIKLKDNSYLKDSFRLFVNAMNKALENDNQEMIDCAGQWLNWIKTCVAYFPEEIKLIIEKGIEAFFDVLKLQGVELDNITGSPTVPWYSEDLLFDFPIRNLSKPETL